MRIFTLLIACLFAPSIGVAHEYKIGDLVVDHPAAKTTPATAMAGAGYLTIMNMGDTSDSLIAVEADFPRVMIHDTKVENDVATMFHIDEVDIAPGETITFAPGGKHIMFMGLDGDPFEEGEKIPATLVFENAGSLEIMFSVETLEQITGKADAAAEVDHSAHGDHGKEGHADGEDHSNH